MFKNILHKVGLLFDKDKELYALYNKILGFTPTDLSYYREAFLHRSSSVRNGAGKRINNERLEFLGDAILNAIVADIVFKDFPDKQEGFLTTTRSKIVQRETLNKIGISLNLDKVIKASAPTQSHNSYMYGNAFEALIGAIYLDKGYKFVQRFIIDKVISNNLHTFATEEQNYKSRLIEWAQKNKLIIDFPLISSDFDKNHSPVFKSAVVINEISVAEGTGYSKKESHQNASKEAIHTLKTNKELKETIIHLSNKNDTAENDNYTPPTPTVDYKLSESES